MAANPLNFAGLVMGKYRGWLVNLCARVFAFQGRLRAGEFFVLLLLIPTFVSLLAAPFKTGVDWQSDAMVGLTVGVCSSLIALLLFTKRLHDHDMSGWWALLGLPVVALQAYDRWRHTILNPDLFNYITPWWHVLAMLYAWFVVIAFMTIGFVPGKDADNRFGPSPRRKGESEPAPAPAD